MQSFTKTMTSRAVFAVAAIGAAAVTLPSQVSSAAPLQSAKVPAPAAVAVIAAKPKVSAAAAVAAVQPKVSAAAAVAATKAAAAPVVRTAAASSAKPLAPEAVRAQIKFETARWGGKPVQTLDESSRILLVRAAAEKAGLREVGLSYEDVYGVIEAETSWIQRTGASKDGTPNLGLAQFEPRTAKGMGLTDPEDPVQAVFAAAQYMKMGAQWASGRIGHLKGQPDLYAAKLREGVSVHYNLSIKGRNKWTGLNTEQLPVETRRHIRNAAEGAREAAELARLLSA